MTFIHGDSGLLKGFLVKTIKFVTIVGKDFLKHCFS